jgi:hypothetical protein
MKFQPTLDHSHSPFSLLRDPGNKPDVNITLLPFSFFEKNSGRKKRLRKQQAKKR